MVAVYDYPAVRIRKRGREKIVRREEVITDDHLRERLMELRLESMREKYADVLAVYRTGDTYIEISCKLNLLPVAAWQKLECLKRAKLI